MFFSGIQQVTQLGGIVQQFYGKGPKSEDIPEGVRSLGKCFPIQSICSHRVATRSPSPQDNSGCASSGCFTAEYGVRVHRMIPG